MVTARAETRLLDFLRVRVTQSVFRLERGEHVYLPEPGADRLVMRSLSGRGERVRVELGLPFAGGELSGAVYRTSGDRLARAEWTLDWTRRARSAAPEARIGRSLARVARVRGNAHGGGDEPGIAVDEATSA